jgi:hypothetical protein
MMVAYSIGDKPVVGPETSSGNTLGATDAPSSKLVATQQTRPRPGASFGSNGTLRPAPLYDKTPSQASTNEVSKRDLITDNVVSAVKNPENFGITYYQALDNLKAAVADALCDGPNGPGNDKAKTLFAKIRSEIPEGMDEVSPLVGQWKYLSKHLNDRDFTIYKTVDWVLQGRDENDLPIDRRAHNVFNRLSIMADMYNKRNQPQDAVKVLNCLWNEIPTNKESPARIAKLQNDTGLVDVKKSDANPTNNAAKQLIERYLYLSKQDPTSVAAVK